MSKLFGFTTVLGEYEVLEISFRKSLKDQVRDRMDYLAEQREKEATEERERDLKQLERIRKNMICNN